MTLARSGIGKRARNRGVGRPRKYFIINIEQPVESACLIAYITLPRNTGLESSMVVGLGRVADDSREIRHAERVVAIVGLGIELEAGFEDMAVVGKDIK